MSSFKSFHAIAAPRTTRLVQAAASRRRQRGIGFFGLLFVAAVVGGLGYIGLKSFPIYAEYMKINRVVKKVSNEGSRTAPEIQTSFDRSAAVEDIESIRGHDLVVDMTSGKPVVSFAYTKKIPLIPPVSLVFDFEGRGD